MGVKVAGTEFSVDRKEIYPKDILANIYFIFWYSNKKTRGWTLSMAVTHILFVVEVLRTRNCYASILLKFVRQYMILVCVHFTEICRTRYCYLSILLKFVGKDIATCPFYWNLSDKILLHVHYFLTNRNLRDCYPSTLPLTSLNLQRHTYELLKPLARLSSTSSSWPTISLNDDHRHCYYCCNHQAPQFCVDRQPFHHHSESSLFCETIIKIINIIMIMIHHCDRLLPNLERVSIANFERSESYLDGEDHLPILASFKRFSFLSSGSRSEIWQMFYTSKIPNIRLFQ